MTRAHPSRALRCARRAAAATLIACLVHTAAVSGQVQRPFPIPMRIEGFVGAKPEGVKSLDRWAVAVDGLPVAFHVTKLEPLGVDIAYWNILNKLEPLPITFTLYGDPQLVRAFATAPAGVPIAVIGNFEAGPGPVTLLLASVVPLPAPTLSAAAATPFVATPTVARLD